jgi:preprotein translocase SecE subunit
MSQEKMEETDQLVDVRSNVSEKFSLVRYVRESRSEFGKIVWPGRAEAARLSAVILGITISMALLVAALDYISAEIILMLDRVF